MMFWLLAFVALAIAKEYITTDIPSEPHHQYTKDTSLIVWPWKSYKTSHHTPPHMSITHRKGKLANGYIFISPVNQNKNDGTYELTGTGFIMDSEGDLIFAAEETGMDFCDEWVGGMTDFRAQDYNGRRYITYWNGCNHRSSHWGHRWGRVTFIDEEYTNFTLDPDLHINTFDDAPRGQIDVHEHQMTDRNTMVVTSYNNTQYDLTALGGPADAWIADGMFFEIDIETKEVLFEWRALDHLDPRDSRFSFTGPGGGVTKHLSWDWLHINSVQRVGEDYLISARHHWAVYLISGKDGSIIWKLDGINGGSFGSIPETFRWQHHARGHNVSEAGMTVSLFNNMVNGKKTSKFQTQGLAFWLPMPASKDHPPVRVKRMETPKDMLFSGTQGSYQMDLGNGGEFGKGNAFIGYGKVPVIREYGPADDGSDLRWQAQFGEANSVMCYRGFKMEWKGTPKNWDPMAVFEDPRVNIPRVYVSWNGATEITGWVVYSGKSKDSLRSVGVAKKKAFETVFELGNATCVQLGAIRDGEVIRKSNVACLDYDGMDSGAIGHSGKIHGEPTKVNDDELQAQKEQLEIEKQKLQEEKKKLETEKTQLHKEKAELKDEKDDLSEEQDVLDGEAWAAYRLFFEVALVVILVVAGAWVYVLWRDWRRRRQYTSVPDNDLGPLGLSLRLPRWARSRPVKAVSKRHDSGAAEYDERTLDDLPPMRDQSQGMHGGRFRLTEDDEDDENTHRRPFI